MQAGFSRDVSRIYPLFFALAIFGVAVLARAQNLEQYVTTDEDLTLARSGNFAEALADRRWMRTYQIGHPEVTVMWIATVALTPDWARTFSGTISPDSSSTGERGATDVESFMSALGRARLGLVVAHGALIALVAMLVWRLAGPSAGLLSGSFLALEPFLVAHGQLLRADALMAELALVTVLSAFAFWRAGAGAWALGVSSAAFGLGLLTKTPIVLVAPVVVAIALLSTRRPGLLAWMAGSILIPIALWPAMWVRPIETIQRVIDYTALKGGSPMDAGSFLLGAASPDPGPLFYPVALLLRLSPVACLGIVALIWLRGGRNRSLSMILLAAFAVMAVTLTLAPKKADRYVIPVVPIVVTLGSLGFAEVTRRVARPGSAALAGLGLATLSLSLLSVRPYLLAYYNPLAGGGYVASRLLLVGWGEGLDQVASYLNSQEDAANSTAAVVYPDSLDAQFVGKAVPLSAYDVADVAVRYVAADQRGLMPPTLESALQQLQPDFEVVINGIQYAQVYRLPSTEFEGGIVLDGIDISERTVARDTTVRLRIRWKEPSEPTQVWRTRVSWLRQDGQPMGESFGPWREPGSESSMRDERISFLSPRTLGRYTIALALQRHADLALMPVTRRPVGLDASPNQLVLPSLSFRVQ